MNQKKVEMIYGKVENIVEQYPDSALIFLDAIQNPYELSKAQYARYVLLSVQAKDKDDQDIATDTLIFQARDYFQKKNDGKNLALAAFYSGRVLQSQGKFEEAMKTYFDAKETARKTKNIYLCGLIEFFIGDLNYDHDVYNEAITHYKNSIIDFSHFEGKCNNQIAAYSCIGNSFLLIESVDSAFIYYSKGLELAEQCNDSIVQISVRQNMGVAYLQSGNPEQAKILLRQALSLTVDEINKAKIYRSLAEISFQENKKDSAVYYSKLALDMSDNDRYLKVGIYGLLSEIEESAGSYQKSLDYYKQYVDNLSSVFEENESSNILEVQKKYDFELLQSANKKLVIQRLWIFIALILFITIVVFVIYRNHKSNKEALLIAKQQIYQLKEMVAKKDDDNPNSTDEANNDMNRKLRDVLFKQLDAFKKISLVEGYLKKEEKERGKEVLKKVNAIIYDSNNQFDWNMFYRIVNTLYDDFLIRLAGLYPELDKEEILICCLSKIGFSNMEIALLVKSKKDIIQKKKSVIREKTGMKKQVNFVKQLEEIVKKEC